MSVLNRRVILLCASALSGFLIQVTAFGQIIEIEDESPDDDLSQLEKRPGNPVSLMEKLLTTGFSPLLKLQEEKEFRKRFDLDTRLTYTLRELRSTCKLTPVQYEKLALAGRVEIAQLFAMAQEFRREVMALPNDSVGVGQAVKRADVFMKRLNLAFDAEFEESLVFKVCQTTLSADQRLKLTGFAERVHAYRVRKQASQ